MLGVFKPLLEAWKMRYKVAKARLKMENDSAFMTSTFRKKPKRKY